MLLSFSDKSLLQNTLAISLNFLHPHLVFAITASCTPRLELRISPKYENLATFSILSIATAIAIALKALVKIKTFPAHKIYCIN